MLIDIRSYTCRPGTIKKHLALYESMGFINREGRPDGPVMYFYEREL